ncbi:MAG: chemotaxis protein CheW [Alcaligenaceae bacterium]
MSTTTDFVTFYVGGHYLGISVADVLELNRNMDVTPVPKSPKIVRGVTNLRGQLVAAIDMYERLKLDKNTANQEPLSIILQCDGYLIAILVDDVGEILSLEADNFEPPPTNFSKAAKELIVGVYKLPEKLLLILNAKRIAERLEPPQKQLAVL